MRFAAVVKQTQLPPRLPASELLRRIVSTPLQALPRVDPPPPENVPVDLDQRVRLVGEW